MTASSCMTCGRGWSKAYQQCLKTSLIVINVFPSAYGCNWATICALICDLMKTSLRFFLYSSKVSLRISFLNTSIWSLTELSIIKSRDWWLDWYSILGGEVGGGCFLGVNFCNGAIVPEDEWLVAGVATERVGSSHAGKQDRHGQVQHPLLPAQVPSSTIHTTVECGLRGKCSPAVHPNHIHGSATHSYRATCICAQPEHATGGLWGLRRALLI